MGENLLKLLENLLTWTNSLLFTKIWDFLNEILLVDYLSEIDTVAAMWLYVQKFMNECENFVYESACEYVKKSRQIM